MSFENGGSIFANYPKSSNEERENVEALKTFAERGSKVLLLQKSDEKGCRRADSTIDGVSWEVKTNHTPTVSAIDNALRSCNGQSKNLVLNIKSDITNEMIENGFWMRIYRTNLERIIVERNGKIEKEYFRDEFILKE